MNEIRLSNSNLKPNIIFFDYRFLFTSLIVLSVCGMTGACVARGGPGPHWREMTEYRQAEEPFYRRMRIFEAFVRRMKGFH